jgi:hypothetical protein
MAAFVASFLGGQPLLISGVTGWSKSTFFLMRADRWHYRSNNCIQQNHLRHLRWKRRLCLPTFHRLGISLGSNISLDSGAVKWYDSSFLVRLYLLMSTLAVKGLKYVTRFACDTFGFYVAAVYIQYGIQVVTRQFGQTSTTWESCK